MPGLLALLRNGCAVDPWARACACNFRGVRAIRAAHVGARDAVSACPAGAHAALDPCTT